MNILLLTDEMLPGGIARHVTDLANGLSERGHSVVVGATNGPMRSRLAPEVQFLSLKFQLSGQMRKNYPGLFWSYWQLLRYARKNRLDIIHSHKRLTDFIGRLIANQAGTLHVSTCHALFDTLKAISWFGETTITTSDAVRNLLIKDFHKDPNRLYTIHLGMRPLLPQSTSMVSANKARLGIERKSVIASIGRLEKSKDRATLLQAVAILERKGLMHERCLVIVGDGPEHDMLVRTIGELGIENCVLLLDSSTNVADIFNMADFCTISSNREGGTLYVNLEAASLGKPHVATNIGGIPEFVVDGTTGLLVPPGSPDELANAIAFLIRNPEEVHRLGHNAYLRFVERHSYDRFIEETIAVYQTSLGQKMSASATHAEVAEKEEV